MGLFSRRQQTTDRRLTPEEVASFLSHLGLNPDEVLKANNATADALYSQVYRMTSDASNREASANLAYNQAVEAARTMFAREIEQVDLIRKTAGTVRTEAEVLSSAITKLSPPSSS